MFSLLATHGLPQRCQFLKVQGRSIQDLLHIRPLRIRGPDGVVPFRQGNGSIQTKIDNRLRLAGETVNMTRRMIVRISDK